MFLEEIQKSEVMAIDVKRYLRMMSEGDRKANRMCLEGLVWAHLDRELIRANRKRTPTLSITALELEVTNSKSPPLPGLLRRRLTRLLLPTNPVPFMSASMVEKGLAILEISALGATTSLFVMLT